MKKQCIIASISNLDYRIVVKLNHHHPGGAAGRICALRPLLVQYSFSDYSSWRIWVFAGSGAGVSHNMYVEVKDSLESVLSFHLKSPVHTTLVIIFVSLNYPLEL